MSVSKDKCTGKWMVQVRMTAENGKTVHRKKRGFGTKREAQVWERRLLDQSRPGPSMYFENFAQLYMDDMESRVKPSTLTTKQAILRTKILPYFGKFKVCEITPADIRRWQQRIADSAAANGKPLAPAYLRTINAQLSAMFQYAVKFWGLEENPCSSAGAIGSKKSREMLFWTREEFDRFIDAVAKPDAKAMFMTLYYTGLREGELLALSPADIDFGASTIKVNKTYARLSQEDVLMPAKTPKSHRTVTLPAVLANCLKEYLKDRPQIGLQDRMFPHTKYYLYKEMNTACNRCGVKRIRIHDLRHSHASLLVELGFSPLLIAERLGHERVSTTMEIYSHLYPGKQKEVAQKLDDLAKSDGLKWSPQPSYLFASADIGCMVTQNA